MLSDTKTAPNTAPLRNESVNPNPRAERRSYRIKPASGLEGSAPIRRGIRPAR